jgi:AraC family transcriptional regulator, regulatory protein of adaptative response / methylated-DNA-[protein]-cysteine methyltransferase
VQSNGLRLQLASADRHRFVSQCIFNAARRSSATPFTTRIYCRPVCPVKQPLTRNVAYYQTAAAAEAAGYRPCLRCRPETAPFCAAWNGTRSTVARALKLIDGGALDNGSVAALADRLGVSSRHLARLFERYIGANPQQVAKTRRVQRAKRLIDETNDQFAQIAYQAGFGSVRRFNAAFRELYGRSPSSIRHRKVSA